MDRSLILSLAEDLQFSLTEEEIQNILTDFSWVESIRDQFADGPFVPQHEICGFDLGYAEPDHFGQQFYRRP